MDHSSASAGEIPIKDEAELKLLLSQALADIHGPGACAAVETGVSLPEPGLWVNDHGAVGLPLAADDALSIKSKCQQSAFGKGSETCIDSSVRRSWELNPDQFILRNPAWDQAINALLAPIRERLNVMSGSLPIRAELYKLLLYEEGAFFKAHQDSEKTPGMFGTLVVALPSGHEGGELSLRHKDERVTFTSAESSESGFSWAAWYSDVFHEVLPVKKGFRLVLTYNLAIAQSSMAAVATPPTVSSFQPRLRSILENWNREIERNFEIPSYAIHRLEHQYTEASLRQSNLKGRDRAQTEALQSVSDVHDNLFLATLERILHRDDECEDEVFGSDLQLKHVVKLSGEEVSKHVVLDESSLLFNEDLSGREADHEEHEGYTGNEGCPATYWYRDTVSIIKGLEVLTNDRKVLIIVPNNAELEFLFQGKDKYRKGLEKLRSMGAESENSHQFLQLARIMLNENHRLFNYENRPEKDAQASARSEVARIALARNNFDLYDKAFSIIIGPLPSELYRLLGVKLVENELSRGRTEHALKSIRWIGAKYEAFKSVIAGHKDATEATKLTKTSQARWNAWFYHDLLNLTLSQEFPLHPPEGKVLANICLEEGFDEERSSLIRDLLDKAAHSVKASFCIQLSSMIDGAQDTATKQLHLLRDVLNSFWATLTLSSLKSGEPLNGMLQVSMAILEEANLSKKTIYDKIEGAVADASISEFEDALLPFAVLIMQGQTPLTEQGTPMPTETKTLVEAIISRYIVTHVGEEPTQPADWSLPGATSPCECTDCAAINAFLISPTQKITNFPLNQRLRKHFSVTLPAFLDPWKNDVTIRRTGGSQTWQMKKTRHRFGSQVKAWRNQSNVARRWMQKMDGEDGRLMPVLGDRYKGLMDAKARAALIQPQPQSNVQPLRSSLKRNLPGDPSARQSKRVATSPANE